MNVEREGWGSNRAGGGRSSGVDTGIVEIRPIYLLNRGRPSGPGYLSAERCTQPVAPRRFDGNSQPTVEKIDVPARARGGTTPAA